MPEAGPLRGEKHHWSPSSSSPMTACLTPELARQVPHVAALLAEIVPVVTDFQRRQLSRLVRGLLLEGEGDAEIAARLRARLAPLAAGDARRPFAFRRDGLSWALSNGLPYLRRGMTLVDCARPGCGQFVRGRATDRVRCDDCEVAAHDKARAEAARRAWESANVGPGRLSRPTALREPRAAAAPGARLSRPALCETAPPSPTMIPKSEVASEAVEAASRLSGPVCDVLAALAWIAPQAVTAARQVAHVLYTDRVAADGRDAACRRRTATATAIWRNVITRYADQLAAPPGQ